MVQLSDLHLLSGALEAQEILAALPEALAGEQARRRVPVELLAITGDVFDSAILPAERAVSAFQALYERVVKALGHPVPTVVVPGNHDRRVHGLLAPHRPHLFHALSRAFNEHVWVHGNGGHFLAGVIAEEFHSIPAWVMAYDSTYLPLGLLSAGGALRQEDLLHAAAQIADRHPEWPLLFLLHHHLVPTPLTDVGPVETDTLPNPLRWIVNQVLPRLVSNADREELTMTALGAGTALSILHTLGRPVLVLHGHKHYANARHLRATKEKRADVLILSAGSAGLAQSWFPTTAREAARLWPSFNAIELDSDSVEADVVSFGYRGDALGETRVTPLVSARRRGVHWDTALVSERPEEPSERRLEENTLSCKLAPSLRPNRWDVEYRRGYTGSSHDAPDSFEDTIDALDDSLLVPADAREATLSPPCQLPLRRGQVASFRIEGALCRHVEEAYRLFGRRWAPYSWLGIMNRYFSREVRIEVHAEHGALLSEAFASETDLGSGSTRPLPLTECSVRHAVVVFRDCPARTLVRIHWPMDTG